MPAVTRELDSKQPKGLVNDSWDGGLDAAWFDRAPDAFKLPKAEYTEYNGVDEWDVTTRREWSRSSSSPTGAESEIATLRADLARIEPAELEEMIDSVFVGMFAPVTERFETIEEDSSFADKNSASTAVPIETPPSRSVPAGDPAPVAPARHGQVNMLLGCRGGAGATTLATNLAGELAARGRETLLIDLDLQLSDALLALDIDRGGMPSFGGVARAYMSLDDATLKESLGRHRSGLYVLAHRDKRDAADADLLARIPAFLDHLRGRFDAIVIDGVHDLDQMARAALRASDVITLIATQDDETMRRARRAIEVLDELQITPARRRLVVNHYKRMSKISASTLARSLGMPVSLKIASDHATTLRAYRGPLVRDITRYKRIARDLRKLTDLTEAPPA